jgi:hypothetical protein
VSPETLPVWLDAAAIVRAAKERANTMVRTIIEAYLAPNKTFRDVTEVIDNDAMNPLRDFSNACRDELRAHSSHAHRAS